MKEIMDRAVACVKTWLNKDWKVQVPQDWLEACVEWIRSENGGNLSQGDLQSNVLEQWLICDLRDIGASCLPAECAKQEKITLQGNFSLQINSLIDVSCPYYGQLQKIKGTENANVEVSATQVTQTQSDCKASRMLMLDLTDGSQSVQGMEYKLMASLSATLTPGTKIVVSGPVVCRRGVLMLTGDHVTVLGGEVDSLTKENTNLKVVERKINNNIELSKGPPLGQRKAFDGNGSIPGQPSTRPRQQPVSSVPRATTARPPPAPPSAVIRRSEADDFEDDDLDHIDLKELEAIEKQHCEAELDIDADILLEHFDFQEQQVREAVAHVHISGRGPSGGGAAPRRTGNSNRDPATRHTGASNRDPGHRETTAGRPSRSPTGGAAPDSKCGIIRQVPMAGMDRDSVQRDVVKRESLSSDVVKTEAPGSTTGIALPGGRPRGIEGDNGVPSSTQKRKASAELTPPALPTLSGVTTGAGAVKVKVARVEGDEEVCQRLHPHPAGGDGDAEQVIEGVCQRLYPHPAGGDGDAEQDDESQSLVSPGPRPPRCSDSATAAVPDVRAPLGSTIQHVQANWPPKCKQCLCVNAHIATLLGRLGHNEGDCWSLDVRINDGTASMDVGMDDKLLASLIGFSAQECKVMREKAKSDKAIRRQMALGIRQCQESLVKMSKVSSLVQLNLDPQQERPLVTEIAALTRADTGQPGDRLPP